MVNLFDTSQDFFHALLTQGKTFTIISLHKYNPITCCDVNTVKVVFKAKAVPLPIGQEIGWAPEPVWTKTIEEKSFRLCQGLNLIAQSSRP
jgi:hypothetical protein